MNLRAHTCFCLSQGNIMKLIKVPHTAVKTMSHTHTVAQSHTHTYTYFMYTYTLHVLFKRRTATGIKEFLNLFILQMGRRRPDGRVANSWFKIWSFFVKIEWAFRKICCSQKRARSVSGSAVILEVIRKILCRLFLFFTPKLWNQQMKVNDRSLSIKDL